MGDSGWPAWSKYDEYEEPPRPWWWIPFDAIAGVTWIALSLFTGGLFFGVVFFAWLFHQRRASEIMHQMGWGVLALALALVVTVVVVAAAGS